MPSSPRTAKCLRCGKTLTSSKSIANRMGYTCRAKALAAAQVADLSEYKNEKAARENVLDLIELGGLIPQSRKGLYLAVSKSNTDVTYLVDTQEHTCSCPSNLKRGYCTHLTTADAVEGSKTKLAA